MIRYIWVWPPVNTKETWGYSILLLNVDESMCPSKWLIGIKGFFVPRANDFVKVEPTNKPPIRPGPQVAQNKSISDIFFFASFKGSLEIIWSICKCALDAISRITPPKIACSYWENTIWLKIVLLSSSIHTEVSSHEVSIPRIRTVTFLFLLFI